MEFWNVLILNIHDHFFLYDVLDLKRMIYKMEISRVTVKAMFIWTTIFSTELSHDSRAENECKNGNRMN
jgi:hypothetical protein